MIQNHLALKGENKATARERPGGVLSNGCDIGLAWDLLQGVRRLYSLFEPYSSESVKNQGCDVVASHTLKWGFLTRQEVGGHGEVQGPFGTEMGGF